MILNGNAMPPPPLPTVSSSEAATPSVGAKKRILKAYYYKDAAASACSSFAGLDERRRAPVNGSRSGQQQLGSAAESVHSLSSNSSSASPISTASNQHRQSSKSSASKQPASLVVVDSTHHLSKEEPTDDASSRLQVKAAASTCSQQQQQQQQQPISSSSSSSCIAFFNQILTEDTLSRLGSQSAHSSLKRNCHSLKVVKSSGSLQQTPQVAARSSHLSPPARHSTECLATTATAVEEETRQPVVKKLSERFSLKRKKQKHLEKSRLKELHQTTPPPPPPSQRLSDEDHVDSSRPAVSASNEPRLNGRHRQQLAINSAAESGSSHSSESSLSLSANLGSSSSSSQRKESRSVEAMYSATTTTTTPVYSGAHGNYYTPPHQPQQYQRAVQLALLGKKARKHLPFNAGIKNHGNTCFMNCILQCLFHTSPLADFFVTHQFDNDMQIILRQLRQSGQTFANGYSPFILTKYVYQLLSSLWRNAYNPLYSSDLKQLIGSINPTFAGGNQNDSHEFCIWLLDKLSQELTIKNLPAAAVAPPSSSSSSPRSAAPDLNYEETPPPPRTSSSFIEELFQIQFKSSVVCSKCNFKSSKFETDMMLSLPLPQQPSAASVSPQKSPQQVHPSAAGEPVSRRLRRSVYAHVLLTNLQSIRQLTASNEAAVDQLDARFDPAASAGANYKSKFYLSDFMAGESDAVPPLPAAYTLTAVNAQTAAAASSGPSATGQQQGGTDYRSGSVHARVAFSALFTAATAPGGGKKELAALPTSPAFAVVNADLGDLRKYLAHTYSLAANELVFIDLNRVNQTLSDKEPLRDHLVRAETATAADEPLNDSLCVVELNQLPPKTQQQMPLINIVAINVFYDSTNNGGGESSKRCFPCGMPHVLLINRDCTYAELCRKLLEVQSKYFKDRNFLKYKDLAEKLFTLTLVDSSKGKQRLSPGDELPLYAECVERALTENVKSSSSPAEYIKINIEWRSYEDITNLLKDIDIAKPDFVHRSVHFLSRFDEQHRLAESQEEEAYRPPTAGSNLRASASPPAAADSPITLNDCFELFTQREELTDENSWMCPKCKRQTNAYKNLCINALPPILIIHLKRFFYKSNTSNFKLTTPVWFPVCSLDMGRYLDRCKKASSSSRIDEAEHSLAGLSVADEPDAAAPAETAPKTTTPSGRSSRPCIYDLFAVCNHKGQNMVNGHYTAFCKNFIDTRWYCYDDASCIPMSDMNQTGNIHLNGASGVCTENAYILFYKRRNCMKNEKWWYNYVDRALYESDEFHRYLNAMDAIERQQHEYQMRVQTSSAAAAARTRPSITAASLVMNGAGSGGGVGYTGGSPVARARPPISASSEYKYDQEGRAFLTDLEPVCQRELTKLAERQLQEEILRDPVKVVGRYDVHRNYGDVYSYEGLVVNRYDEQVRPQRLLAAKSSESPSKTTLSRGSPHSGVAGYHLQASSASNLDEAVNSSGGSGGVQQRHRPVLETSKSAHNLHAPRQAVSTSSDYESGGQRSTGLNEFTPSSSSSSSNNEAALVGGTQVASFKVDRSDESPKQRQQTQHQELMNFGAGESQVGQLFRLNNNAGGGGIETSILDYPSDNEYLYNQYAYNQPTIKPRTTLAGKTTTTTTTLPSSNIRYYPVQSVAPANARVSNFYGQAAPQYLTNYQYTTTPASSNRPLNVASSGGPTGYYSTQTIKSPNRSPGNAGNNGGGGANSVNTSASRYINPGSIETTI